MAINVGHSTRFVFRVGSVGLFLLVAVASLASTVRYTQNANRRPRIGLVMNGEGAIGFTQIGVLKWTAEHHIPIDYIAGTSVGGWVGGAYAAGMFPTEIGNFVEGSNLAVRLFRGDAPYQEKGKWATPQKMKLPGLPGFELDAFVSSKHPDAIVPVLPRIANSYRNLSSFDDLPTPFRCEAADLRTGQLLVLESGSLPEALRTCLTLIGVSNPVRKGERILVSGAILDSIPTDLVRRMGAEIVIASFVSGTTAFESSAGESEFSSVFQQIARSLDIAKRENERKGLEKADVLIHPDTVGFATNDFTRLRQLVNLGYDAAQAKAAYLQGYALPDTEWVEYVRNREERKRR
jgi:NTE family protein